MAEEYAGLSKTSWAVVGGFFIVVLLVIDRWIHCTRNVTRFCRCKKPPPDPLEGLPEQPDVVEETGFSRSHDRDFERNWHVVALQRDETQAEQEEMIRIREEEMRQRELERTRKQQVKIVRGVATVGGIQTE